MSRQIILDTETTGREVGEGHRVIEIGCLEMINRKITGKFFHKYVNPERESEADALAVHGLTQEFLASHPLFIQIADEFLEFIKGAQLIIHNAPFDLGFLDSELRLTKNKYGKITDHCSVLDTLPLARQMHPGQRNSLDALCKRYNVNNSHREFHGALLDAELLAKVYLAMTGGQTSLLKEERSTQSQNQTIEVANNTVTLKNLRVIKATEHELKDHAERLAAISKQTKKSCLWEEYNL
jgi:DNA polymerase-3 subunit epsilon